MESPEEVEKLLRMSPQEFENYWKAMLVTFESAVKTTEDEIIRIKIKEIVSVSNAALVNKATINEVAE